MTDQPWSTIALRTVIAMPAYNCETQLARVLTDLRPIASDFGAVWVIDNRSPDGTVSVAVGFIDSIPNLRVFRNTENVSLGGTHKKAFVEARRSGFEYVMILHGDDQALATEVELLCQESAMHNGATVLGSRFAPGARLDGYDGKRILGNKVLNGIYSAASRRRLTDLGSGLNLFRLADLDEGTFLRFGDSLSFNYELILDLVRRGRTFVYVPISWREEDQVSNARNWRVFSSAVRILMRWSVRRETTPGPHRLESDWTEIAHD